MSSNSYELHLVSVALEMRLIHISLRWIIWCCVVATDVSFCAVWSDPLGQMLPPAHVSVIRHVSHVEIADMSFMRSDPVGAVLPASDLIVVSILTHAHDDFLLTCGTVTRNVVTWSPLLCHLVGSLQSLVSPLHRPRPSVSSCSGTLHDLPLCSSNTFSDRRISPSRTLRSLRPCCLCPCPCSSAAHRSALAQDCCQCTVVFSWYRGFPFASVSSSQSLCFPGWNKLWLVRLPSSTHSHLSWCRRSQSMMIDSHVRVLHPLVAVSVCRLCVGKTTRSSGVQQTLAPVLSRTASILRIPRSHLHCDTCAVSPSRVFLYIFVPSVMLSLGVDESSVVIGSSSFRWSTAPRYDLSLNNRSARFIDSSCMVVDVAFWTCFTSSLLTDRRIASVPWSCWSRTYNCLTAVAICSSGVDMVAQISLLARGATRRAQLSYPQRLPTLDSELGYSHCPAASFSLLTGLTLASPGAPRFTLSTRSSPLRQTASQFRDAITVPFFREATITAPLPCCECMRWDVTYTHVFGARRRAAGFMSHMFTHALTVCTQGIILTDWSTLLDLCVSSAAHMLSQSSMVPWQVLTMINTPHTQKPHTRFLIFVRRRTLFKLRVGPRKIGQTVVVFFFFQKKVKLPFVSKMLKKSSSIKRFEFEFWFNFNSTTCTDQTHTTQTPHTHTPTTFD